jgi:phosphoesterase RecJ-like protein
MNKTFTDFYSKYSSFLIITHETPDADALGSSLALAMYLEKLGKSAKVVLSKDIPINLEFLIDERLTVESDKTHKTDYDAIFVLDSSNKRRAPINLEHKVWKLPICNIDHHQDNDSFGDKNILNFSAAATGEILYDLFDKKNIDFQIATQLFAAIVGDTGGFKHANTTSKILRIAADLMEYDFDAYTIKMNIVDFRTKKAFKLVVDAIKNVKVYDLFATMQVSKDIISKYELSPTEYPELVNYIRGIEGIYASIVFTEVYDNNVKVSFRSVPPVDISHVAKKFGGGGHRYASGCQINGKLDEVVEKVVTFTNEYLNGLELE